MQRCCSKTISRVFVTAGIKQETDHVQIAAFRFYIQSSSPIEFVEELILVGSLLHKKAGNVDTSI